MVAATGPPPTLDGLVLSAGQLAAITKIGPSRTAGRTSGRQRMLDVPGIENIEPFADVLAPAGHAAGVATCLNARGGRYAGMLHLSTNHDVPASVDKLAVPGLVSAALAACGTGPSVEVRRRCEPLELHGGFDAPAASTP